MLEKELADRLQQVALGNSMLPTSCYTCDRYYQLELEQFQLQGGFAIGYASDVSQPGQVRPCEVNGKPYLLTRSRDGELHVFANVCRHRGHLLVTEFCNKTTITCPYHAWSYQLDGSFIHAPFWDGTEGSRPNDELRQTLALIPQKFCVWNDIIFLQTEDRDAEGLQFSALEDRWRHRKIFQRQRKFSGREYTISGNWKLVVENFLDNYHLPWVHSQFAENMQAALGLEVENIQLSKEIIGFSHPTSGIDKIKTDKPLPCWVDLDEDTRIRQDLFFIFPNVCMVMEGDYLWTMLLFPDGAERCKERINLYVVGDDALEDQYTMSRDQLAQSIYAINEQDVTAIDHLQRGHQGDAASYGVFNDFHDQLGKWFHQRAAEKMLEKGS